MVVLFQLLSPTSAGAQEDDPRLIVVLGEEVSAQGTPDTRLLLDQALPVLWDRIIPLARRHSADALGSDTRMVAKIVPGHESTQVEFDGQRVFAALREAHIPAIVTPPRFHLLISVQNVAGQVMQQTTQLLVDEAARLAPSRGIELSDSGTGLVMTWRWLDAQHAELSVRGQSRLGEFVETREITDADPLPVMQQWLDEVLLRARDAYAYDAGVVSDTAAGGLVAGQVGGDYSIQLVVQRGGTLLEQVALEESLSHDPRVRQLLPLTLSRGMQSYRLQLEGGDTSWLSEWFARRGYRMDRLADGSLVVQ